MELSKGEKKLLNVYHATIVSYILIAIISFLLPLKLLIVGSLMSYFIVGFILFIPFMCIAFFISEHVYNIINNKYKTDILTSEQKSDISSVDKWLSNK